MKTSIQVQNLKCGGCDNTITTKLSDIKNISGISIAVDKSEVSFDYLNDEDLENVIEKLKALGYPSIDDANSLGSKAKSFVSCATGKLSR